MIFLKLWSTGSRVGLIEVAPRTDVKFAGEIYGWYGCCVDNLRRPRLMCEVISCDKRGKGRLHISETFPTFCFFEQDMGSLLLLFLFGERRMNGASSWTPPKKGRLFELRQDHYTASIIKKKSYQYFLRAWVSVSLVPRRSLLILCPREVSVTSQLMVESRNDRAENAWGLGWVSVLSNWFKLGLSLSKSEPVNRPCSGYRHAYRRDDFFGSKQTVRTQTCVLGC